VIQTGAGYCLDFPRN